jgi:uncharacterized protein YhaN
VQQRADEDERYKREVEKRRDEGDINVNHNESNQQRTEKQRRLDAEDRQIFVTVFSFQVHICFARFAT